MCLFRNIESAYINKDKRKILTTCWPAPFPQHQPVHLRPRPTCLRQTYDPSNHRLRCRVSSTLNPFHPPGLGQHREERSTPRIEGISRWKGRSTRNSRPGGVAAEDTASVPGYGHGDSPSASPVHSHGSQAVHSADIHCAEEHGRAHKRVQSTAGNAVAVAGDETNTVSRWCMRIGLHRLTSG